MSLWKEPRAIRSPYDLLIWQVFYVVLVRHRFITDRGWNVKYPSQTASMYVHVHSTLVLLRKATGTSEITF